ncbi:restriction endonuclease [Micromonospora craterilacus]|uniref:Restriction endonuclease n=1 Tax=Micromonospora craterilacus TaxID=1655439 RepID=A0A2W2EGW8_9ACTN|nr:restriction endonuclease [Micromonospora craterilacus]PZG16119.1 restriction endonuclease [Micromonospora craterilacus]
MTLIRVREAGPTVQVSLSTDDARRLAVSETVDVRPDPADGVWHVRAGRKVGALRIGRVEVHIEPKVPIARLLFLMGYARDPAGWRDEIVSLTEHTELVPALAAALWRQTDRALRPGLLQGYRTIDETSPVLRGRLRETAQLTRRAGRPLPLEVRHDDYTIDITENRILATAVDRMLRVPGIDDPSRRGLRHLAGRFAGVTRLRPGEPVPAWRLTRLNERLLVALRLAELVLASSSVDGNRGPVLGNGFLLDMWRVYEDFLSVALRAAVESAYGGRVLRQARHHLDQQHRLELRPDILWRDGTGVIGAVVDAKYKVDSTHGDAYQMLAYCIAYGLSSGHLVYAGGAHPPLRHVVHNAGIEIRCHFLDLDCEPVELLARIHALAGEITRSGHVPTVAFR